MQEPYRRKLYLLSIEPDCRPQDAVICETPASEMNKYSSERWCMLAEAEVVFENFTSREQRVLELVEALREEKSKVYAAAETKVQRIEERIQSMLALPNHSEVELEAQTEVADDDIPF